MDDIMNYQQYLELKRRCEIKIRIFTFGLYAASMFAFVQSVLLVLKVNFSEFYTNLIVLDQLYSLGYQQSVASNVIFALFFFGAFALISFMLIAASFVGSMKRCYVYYFVLFVYGIDSILALATGQYLDLLVHAVIITLISVAVKNIKTFAYLNNNVWGYQ
jgi:hypothetical protein